MGGVSWMIVENNAREQGYYYPLKMTATNSTEEVRPFLLAFIQPTNHTYFLCFFTSPWSNEKTSLSLPRSLQALLCCGGTLETRLASWAPSVRPNLFYI